MNNLWKFEHERVEVICTDGQVLRGVVGDYIDADDNEPPKESIVLDLFEGGYPTEIFGDEIMSVEVLE